MGKFTFADDIKTDDDLNFYGWKMRLMQIDEDISRMQKDREEIYSYYLASKKKISKR